MLELIDSVKPTCRECRTSCSPFAKASGNEDARLKHFLYSQETGGAFRCATGASPGITRSLATVTEGANVSDVTTVRDSLCGGIRRRQLMPLMSDVADSASDLSRGPKSSLPEGEQNQTVRGEQQGKLNHGDCRESPLQENRNGKSGL